MASIEPIVIAERMDDMVYDVKKKLRPTYAGIAF
ncbi:hypothetical protein SAMN05192535_0734 [Shouchella rhizosphaerae]|nr:hypothetical protein SAMN05192535_0734 [Shouchella rhizosphaerae]